MDHEVRVGGVAEECAARGKDLGRPNRESGKRRKPYQADRFPMALV